MVDRLRKKTEWHRRTVDQLGRVYDRKHGRTQFLVHRERNAKHGQLRRVTVVLPHTPQVHVSLDELPSDIAHGRAYMWPAPPTGRTICFTIRADQTICAISEDGTAETSVIIEYLED